MFLVILFTDIALFHLLDISNSITKHARSNSSEPFIQMAQITHKQLSGEMVIGYRQVQSQKPEVRTTKAEIWQSHQCDQRVNVPRVRTKYGRVM